MSCVLALDQGTTSSRAILYDAGGAALAVAQQEFGQHFPQPGWVEHDPEQLWQSQLDTARQALAAAGRPPGEVAAVGLANQRETAVVWERSSGRPVHRAIVWQDRRTAPRLAALRAAGCEAWVTARTGLLLDPYFSATKIAWILDHVPGARQRAGRGELAAGTVDAWLLWRLTGGRLHRTDLTNASRTLLCDLATGAWDPELLELFQVPAEVLPDICPSSGVVGETDTALFGKALPVAGVAGDQQAALFGQLCTRPGMVKNTYGTGCFLLAHAGSRPPVSRCRLLATAAWQRAGRPAEYALEGSVFSAGAAVQWLRDGLGLISSAAQVEELARQVRSSEGLVFVPALVGLGAPHWRPAARGIVRGITRGTTAAHLARATLEGIALQVREVLEAMKQDSGEPLRILKVDGGACANNLLLEIQADLCGVDISRPEMVETTALGAALLAGLATRFWSSRDEIRAAWREERRFRPEMRESEVREILGRWQEAVQRA
ncbi:MAG: glycerol kinase GlpK [Gemmatimonadota bacterium]